MDLLKELKKLSEEEKELKLFYRDYSINSSDKDLRPVNSMKSDIFFIYDRKENGFYQELSLKDYNAFEFNLKYKAKYLSRKDFLEKEKECLTINKLISLMELYVNEKAEKVIFTYRSGSISTLDLGFELIDRLYKESIEVNGKTEYFYVIR